MLKRILLAGGVGGIVAGGLLSIVQVFQVVPIILEAETVESIASVAGSKGHKAAPVDGHSHGGGEAWVPEDGFERTLWTAIANVGTAVGFGLLLSAGFALREHVTLAQGMLWGLAGFAAFFIAPSLGLPPEIPGVESAPLDGRQLWWLFAVACTAAGLALLAFSQNWGLKGAGAVVLLVPHVLGAPQPGAHGGPGLQDLAEQFFIASTIANCIFWIALGGITAFLFRRLH